MHRIAINEVSTFRWSFQEDVARYRYYGFGGIGLWRHKISDYCEQAIADQVRSNQLHVSSLQWAGGFTGNEGLSFAEAIEDAEAAIRTASIVGAGCLIVHPGGQAGHTRNHAHRLLHAALRELVPIARDFGVRLAIEPMEQHAGRDFTFLHELDSSLDLIADYHAHELGLVFDLFHFGYDRSQRKRLAAEIDRIALVQLSDRKALNASLSRCFLGDGFIPVRDWLHYFQRIGYRGLFEIELFGSEFYEVDPHRVLDRTAATLSSALSPAIIAQDPRSLDTSDKQ